ncbi:hypothetical protein SCC393_0300115 [Aggregatibacter actinomycetemcomitans serotype e str. SCC393]|nr:hypothetical protein A160_0209225 [Aggregatibacter actinomycetemcomitans serotype e str. A160]KOE68945.1 hypothetical protein SCC393_0300115 [Aggregatibacter actinomycetemcomitans serotype e str. SCC393]KYK79266.1 hypothetical protein SA2876_02640 [Aggregatibacter actinomycetemcomitans serotype e str. SA2876]
MVENRFYILDKVDKFGCLDIEKHYGRMVSEEWYSTKYIKKGELPYLNSGVMKSFFGRLKTQNVIAVGVLRLSTDLKK